MKWQKRKNFVGFNPNLFFYDQSIKVNTEFFTINQLKLTQKNQFFQYLVCRVLQDWIVIDNPKSNLDLDCQSIFFISIQIQNIRIVLSRNKNFMVDYAPTMKQSYFLSKFSNN